MTELLPPDVGARTCLRGTTPYVRLPQEPHGKKCRLSRWPVTVCQRGRPRRDGRLSTVELCRSSRRSQERCASVRIYDLQYGLPVQVRDQVLAEEGCKDSVVAVPQSDANRAWMTAQQERDIEQGKAIAGCVPTNAAAAARLQGMASRLSGLCSTQGTSGRIWACCTRWRKSVVPDIRGLRAISASRGAGASVVVVLDPRCIADCRPQIL